MKKLSYILLFILSTNTCFCQKGILGVINTKISAKNILIIFFGESNSGGLAFNSDATSTELSSRGRVQLWNNNSNTAFYNSEPGVNSLIGHAGLEAYVGTRHGWELELGNKVYANAFQADTVFLVKAGEGGSYIGDWCSGCAYQTTWTSRVNGAIAYLMAKGKPLYIYVMYSQGINDADASHNPSTWYTNTVDLFTRTRTSIGAVNFYVTHIPRNNSSYIAIDDQITNLGNNLNYVFPITTSDLAIQSDLKHWTYLSMKTICDRMLAYILADFNSR